jgi:hypothetical protein
MEVKERGRVTAELLVKFRAAISPQGAHHARSSAQRHLTHMGADERALHMSAFMHSHA